MSYDFDKITDRKGTKCLKYDFATARGKKEGLISMWVADMDFPTAPEILDSLSGVVNHGIFGYTESDDAYYQSVACWYRTHFNWSRRGNGSLKLQAWYLPSPQPYGPLHRKARACSSSNPCITLLEK